ncbi:glycosyltransferase [Prochlorococcus sp. MIT 1300]|uniref:glycosyltransferase n=1 Tax=Prochlorococcus sp. MIT 1300 TaxID=3096218 RepID=UPI002A758074|nr:glycosyltransferase [Prochlorococcus sp. MIT 1300]
MDQLVREWPPGFGGVERVAHRIALELKGKVFTLRPAKQSPEPLAVDYARSFLLSISMGKIIIPFPSKDLMGLLISQKPLLGHLPCPTVLLICLVSRLINPNRYIAFYWHAFLHKRPGLLGLFEDIYQRIALKIIRFFPVICTSPILSKALQDEGIPARQINYLPCAISPEAEYQLSLICQERSRFGYSPTGTLIVIGRLDSYKRVDWLIRVLSEIPAAKKLIVVGDGPDRLRLEELARKFKSPGQLVSFYGRVDEKLKYKLLANADALLLPANNCNEAFGIVQLEAMASGIPAFAFDLPRSGMYWVSQLAGSPWSGQLKDFTGTLEKLLLDDELYKKLSLRARDRYDYEFSNQIWRYRLTEIRKGSV